MMDAEKALLGALLMGGDAIVTTSDFASFQNQRVFEAIGKVRAAGRTPDIVTVSAEVPELMVYISDLTEFCPSVLQAPAYARIVREDAVLRSLKELGQEMAGWDKAPMDALAEAEARVMSLGLAHHTRDFTPIGEGLDAHVDEVMAHAKHGVPRGIQTGFQCIDWRTLGLHGGQICVLAARPGQGKTTLALNIAARVAKEIPVGFLSLEMSREELVQRLICSTAPLDASRVRGGRLSDTEARAYREAADMVKRLKLFISDDAATSLPSIRSQARQLVRKQGVGLLVVDYLQLLRPGERMGLYEAATLISREMKLLAKSLDIPIILLSQLSRMSEQEKNRKPRLSDLRDSGAIEQDADCVLFLHREAFDSIEMDLIVAKNRHGATGSGTLDFEAKYNRFFERTV